MQQLEPVHDEARGEILQSGHQDIAARHEEEEIEKRRQERAIGRPPDQAQGRDLKDRHDQELLHFEHGEARSDEP